MAYPTSAWDFLITDGQGCYIPAYQRPYSWDRSNVSRLLEDALHGVNQLLDRPDTISFLGTIIAIHDIKYKTVQPVFKPEVAPRVMTIIDGQQRICTFLMANAVFHDELKRLARHFAKKSEEHLQWLNEQCQEMIAALQKSFELDRSTGSDHFRYYPRIIRAYDDVWSKRQGQARYSSPIARLIWEYINHHRNETQQRFQYKPKDEQGNDLVKHAPIADIYSFMSRELRNICGNKHRDYDFPDLISVVNDADFLDSLWGYELPDSVTEFINHTSSDTAYQRFCETLRTIIFAKYMNDRMAFTIVVTESEDDAFDMFEALNTTGEPLTAFESFKPRVIEVETLEHYDVSPSYHYIGRIEDYLDTFKKAEQKQKATSEYALSETGAKLQKRLTGC